MIEQVLTMKRTAALCLVGAFCSLNAQAQKIQVKGNLVDGKNRNFKYASKNKNSIIGHIYE